MKKLVAIITLTTPLVLLHLTLSSVQDEQEKRLYNELSENISFPVVLTWLTMGYLKNPSKLELARKFSAPQNATRMALSPDKTKIAFYDEETTKTYVNGIDGTPLFSLLGEKFLAWAPTGKIVTVGKSSEEPQCDSVVHVWNPDAEKGHRYLGFLFKEMMLNITALAFSPCGKQIAYSGASGDKTDVYFTYARQLQNIDLPVSKGISHKKPCGISWSSQGTKIAIRNKAYYHSFNIYNTSDGNEPDYERQHNAQSAWHPTCDNLIAVKHPYVTTIELWDSKELCDTGNDHWRPYKRSKTLSAGEGPCIAWSPDGGEIAAPGASSNTISIINLETGTPTETVAHTIDDVQAMIYDKDMLILLGSNNKTKICSIFKPATSYDIAYGSE